MRTLTIFLGLCLAAASFSCGGGSSAATHTTVQPPVSPASLSVSNVSADVLSNNSVVITWTTSLGSTSQVEYGWSASYGSMTPLDSTAVVNHSVTPSGLSPGMSYHYRVHSTDGSDQAVRGDQSFSTPAAASASAPLCSNPQTGKVLSATPSLFQGSGRITFHDNVLVDGQYAAAVFENQDLPLELAYIYNNTVYTTQSGIYFGSAASTADAVVGNLVLPPPPLADRSHIQQTTSLTLSPTRVNYVNSPSFTLGSMNFYPLLGKAQGTALDLSAFANNVDYAVDFNRSSKGTFTFRGAYAGAGTNPGWQLQADIKPVH